MAEKDRFMEDIEKRLREATDICLASHAEWATNRKNGQTREKLMEAVHELRKVAARLEIEMAISERDEMAAKPIPIPPHRASSKRRPGDDYGPDDDSAGNSPGYGGGGEGGGFQQESGIARTMRRRRPGGHGGGHGGGGQHGGGNYSGGGNNGNVGNRQD
jgi:hypothetical protein